MTVQKDAHTFFMSTIVAKHPKKRISLNIPKYYKNIFPKIKLLLCIKHLTNSQLQFVHKLKILLIKDCHCIHVE